MHLGIAVARLHRWAKHCGQVAAPSLAPHSCQAATGGYAPPAALRAALRAGRNLLLRDDSHFHHRLLGPTATGVGLFPMNLLDPDVIAKAESLGMRARLIVEGYRVGEHRSPFHGFALEFAQHREYGGGDDLKHLDWKLLGKTDRLYIKQYEQDTNFTANILLDGSASMNFGSGTRTKLEYAKTLAACLAYTILAQRDAVALDIFDTTSRVHLQRTDNPGRLHDILLRLAAFEAAATTDLGGALRDLSSQLRAKGIVILLSDLLDSEEAFCKGVERLRFQGNEVIVFHVLDPEEITFPLQGAVRFHDLEGGPDILSTAEDIRAGYLAEFTSFQSRIRLACERAGIHYVLADTGVPVGETLNAYLAYRRKTTAR